MIKNIVFDMGGVLIDLNIDRTLNEYFPEELHTTIRENIFYSDSWKAMDRGNLRYEDAIPCMLKGIPEEHHELLTRMITNFYPYMPPIKEMEGFITRLKKAGYKVYLLSNASARFFDEYLNVPSLTMLDGFFISALYKMLKPEPQIYKAFCEKFSLKAEECFFIDDLPQNIQGAIDCGMKGFVFDTRDFAGLEKALNEQNVIF